MEAPIFPTSEKVRKGDEIFFVQHTGLKKRELFAALALQGAIANPNYTFFGSTTKERPEIPEWVLANAVKSADALLKELEKPKDG